MATLQLERSNLSIPFLRTIVVSFATAYTLTRGSWPQIWFFATDPSLGFSERLLSSPIHLSDDVMISLRAGNFVNELGQPQFNRTDEAQPSTSLLAPYLFAILLRLVPEGLAITIYALLAFLGTLVVFVLILTNAKSFMNGAIVVLALTFTTTNLGFSLNGWDHLYQTFFLTSAASLILKSNITKPKYLLISILLILSFLSRSDSIFMAIALIFAAYYKYGDKVKVLFALAFPFAIGITFFITINKWQFSYLTPTTARLKLGASPSIEYSLLYLLKNGLLQFSAITVFFTVFLFILTLNALRKNRIVISLVVGCIITFIFVTFNSDVFSGGRMYWSSACLLSMVFVAYSERITKYPMILSDGFHTLIRHRASQAVIFLLIISPIVGNFNALATGPLIGLSEVKTSSEAQQFRITQWVNGHLNPKDGAIGIFWLGISYHLPEFEIGDFLGKADELIAQTEKKWGPPGHNKWDIDQTIQKWRPQAIIPSGNSDFSVDEVVKQAKIDFRAQTDWGFGPSLILNRGVRESYDYCYLVLRSPSDAIDSWGFFLRKDIVRLDFPGIRCKSSVEF